MPFSYVVFGQLEDAAKLLAAQDPLAVLPGYGEKAFDPGRWAVLGGLLGFDAATAQSMRNAKALAEGDPEEGPWVYEVPTELLERVRKLDPATVKGTARAWVEADFVMKIGGVDYAVDVLERLGGAATKSAQEKQRVLVYCEL